MEAEQSDVGTIGAAGEWLPLVEAAAKLAMTPAGLSVYVRRGDLKSEIRHRPQSGRPTHMIRVADLEAFGVAQGRLPRPELTPALRCIPVTLTLAARLVEVSKQGLHQAIHAGTLRGTQIRLGPTHNVWHVRLGDLETWLKQRSRYERRHRLNPELLAQLIAAAGLPGDPEEESCPVQENRTGKSISTR